MEENLRTIINSCVICFSYKENEFLSIFDTNDDGKIFNKYGEMYEELLNVKIDYNPNFPNYICASCSLQLQLAINLRQKAFETLKKIISISNDVASFIKDENYDQPTEIELDIVDNENKCDELIKQINENDKTFGEEFLEVQYLKESNEDEDDPDIFSPNDNSNTVALDGIFEENCQQISYYVMKDENNSTIIKEKNNIEKRNLVKRRKLPKERTQKRQKFFCDLCPRISFSEDAIEVHKRIHAGLPAFYCEICKKQFKQKIHYKVHMMKHTNERNFICEECGKKFRTKSDLKIHFEIHTGERRYSCDICHKTYRAHSHMKNHRYSHFEKQLECQICHQKYKSPATLRAHIKIIHELVAPQFECEICHKKFKRKHHLKVHLNTHRKANDNYDSEYFDDGAVKIENIENYIENDLEEVIEEHESNFM